MTRKEILEVAEQCVCHDRNEQYGSPEDNFKTIAYLWTNYLNAGSALRPGVGIVIRAKDVAAMMILLKVARVATGSGSQDNWIDLAGYAACGGEIEGKDNDPSIDRH